MKCDNSLFKKRINQNQNQMDNYKVDRSKVSSQQQIFGLKIEFGRIQQKCCVIIFLSSAIQKIVEIPRAFTV
jgi:hypothetical protein